MATANLPTKPLTSDGDQKINFHWIRDVQPPSPTRTRSRVFLYRIDRIGTNGYRSWRVLAQSAAGENFAVLGRYKGDIALQNERRRRFFRFQDSLAQILRNVLYKYDERIVRIER